MGDTDLTRTSTSTHFLHPITTPVLLATAVLFFISTYQLWRLCTPSTEQRPKALQSDSFREFQLIEKEVLSHNTAVYRFALPAKDWVLGLPIGQHISICANCLQPDGSVKEIIRSYTPISGDNTLGYFDLLIKTYPTGNISKHVASLTLGQMIKAKGPRGAFVYVPNMVRHLGMIAGGTGITPMLQIIHAVLAGRTNGDKTEIDLIFANTTPPDILLRQDLLDLAESDPGFRVHFVLSKPPEGWVGGVGHVTTATISKFFPKPTDDVKVLLCGPPAMVSALKKATESIGFKRAKPVSKPEDQVFAF